MADAELSARISLQSDQFDRAAREVMRQLAEMQESMDEAADSSKGFGATLGNFAGGAATLAVNGISMAVKGMTTAFGLATASATGFFAYMVKEASDARQTLNDAARLNIDTTGLQQFTYAAGKAGIESDKAADILKDVNEKMGDFISTGGGEAADVFKKLGLDAKEFIGMAPDQVLQRLADASAGLSQQDKTFLFESLANDASLLIPLLDESGAKMNELKAQALDEGRILSQEELQGLDNFKSGLDEIMSRIIAFGQHLAAYMAGPLNALIEYVDGLIDGVGGMDDAAMAFAENFVAGIVNIIRYAADVYGWFVEWKLALKDAQAMALSLAGALLKVAEFTVKWTPPGMVANLATGGNLSDAIAEMREATDGALADLANERAETAKSVADVQKKAQEVASGIGKAMTDALDKAKADLNKNQATGYAAAAPSQGGAERSRAEYEKRTAEEAAKAQQKAAKAQENLAKQQQAAQQKAAKEQEDLIKRQQAAANSLKEAGNSLKKEDVQKADEGQDVPQIGYFSGAGLDSLKTAATEQALAALNLKQAAGDLKDSAGTMAQPGSLSKAAAAVTANSMNINLAGGFEVKISGNGDALAQGVVNSQSFKTAFSQLFESSLKASLQDIARAVA